MSYNSRSKMSKKRLMKEYALLQANPIENCHASPLEHDLYEWHANIVSPQLPGVFFHLILRFPRNYPEVAPKVKSCSYIQHPNVFGDYICLDLLTMSRETKKTPYRGWTSAYTVSSVLVQLQSFLFEVGFDEIGEDRLLLMKNRALNYKCYTCGHHGSTNIFPWSSEKLPEPVLGPKEQGDKFAWFQNLQTNPYNKLNGYKCEIIKFNREDGRWDVKICDEKIARKVDSGIIGRTLGMKSDKLSTIKRRPMWVPGLYKVLAKTIRSRTSVSLNGNYVANFPEGTTVNIIDIVATTHRIRGRILATEPEWITLKIKGTQESLVWPVDDVYEEPESDVIMEESCSRPKQKIPINLDINPESLSLSDEMRSVFQKELFQFLDLDTLYKLKTVHEDFDEAVEKSKNVILRKYRCFYTLKDLVTDENCIIGIGAQKVVQKRRSRVTRQLKSCLSQLHPSFDFISYEAFKNSNVRTNVWKDREFDTFIPLYINAEHGKLSLPKARECILNLWQSAELVNSGRMPTYLTAEMILETLAKIMNTTVVNIMKTVEDLNVGELQLFDSIKAIEGYIGCHHLLLAFIEDYPEIQAIANKKVEDFIKDPIARDKERCPDIGELLIYLAISGYSWEEFAPFWIQEQFTRNARWTLAKYPNLLQIENDFSCIRLSQTFKASRTSNRLALFQKFFISEICCPVELKGNENKNKILFQQYNARYGLPPKNMAEELQEHSRRVLCCPDWFEYFNIIDFAAPSAEKLHVWLINSMKISSKKNYHNTNNILRYTEKFVCQPHETIQCDSSLCLCSGDLHDKNDKTLIGIDRGQVDICFVLDCTGSMTHWIEVAKREIRNIMQEVSRRAQMRVRFAIVGYRDHGHEKGYCDPFVVRSFDFTTDPREAQQNLRAFTAGGGCGPEAMSCGLAEAAGLSWNRNAHQICILIADQPCHGLMRHEAYPEGCPCGKDTLRVVHTMKKTGVVVYPVYCGYSNGITTTLFHALARITGGHCVQLQDACCLPEIVLNSVLEETCLEKLEKKLKPFYENAKKALPNARFEQIVQAVFTELKARNIQADSVLPNQNYTTSEEEQVKSFAFCMDLAQARGIIDDFGGHLVSIEKSTKLASHATRDLVMPQVKKCLERLLKKIEFEKFMSQGCLYTQRCWSEEDWDNRWQVFLFENEESTNLQNFHPWCLTERELNEAASMPQNSSRNNSNRYRQNGRGQKRKYNGGRSDFKRRRRHY